jgi:hypothetical protein
MQNVFDAKEAQNYIDRIQKLTSETQRKWGSMTVDKMLAHCNVSYEMVYEPQKHKKINGIAKFIMVNFVKSKVTNDKPYKQNLPTSPAFKIADDKNFDEEKGRLIGFIQKTQQLGAEAFDGKESSSFGKLKSSEWNSLFAKHLNHHLEQFGV